MKILVAPQGFKGSLSPMKAAAAIEAGIRRCDPSAIVTCLPVSDGGDGFLEVMAHATGAELKRAAATGPLGKKIDVPWAVAADSPTAYIELAKVSGLALLKEEDRDPAHATTYGVGDVIKYALDAGIRRFRIGLGGSATNDAATGTAAALGARFLDKNGEDLPLGGKALVNLIRIDLSALDSRILESDIDLFCDVVNLFTGPQGASLVYARQKGASDAMAQELEEALIHFKDVIQGSLGIDLNTIAGAGAAGGAGGGMHALLKGKILSGVDAVLDIMDFDAALEGVDLVVIGEGRMDGQSAHGKAPVGVAQRAKKKNIPVLAVVGCVGEEYRRMHDYGVEAVIPISFSSPTPECMEKAFLLLSDASEQAYRCLRFFK